MSDGLGESDLSRVVFLSEIGDDVAAEEVRDAMAKRFNLGAEALARLFAGPPVVVKSNLDPDTALRYKLAIEATGAKCRIETMPAERDTDRQGYLDRRQHERRRGLDRRERTRAEAITPDRRQGDRRKDSK
ncbi:hypothetical protein [Halofilum ochraceum]|uniref:hypothetical protein n=1 Tax=Halofilum ochraceum TaxID=1611323 RepID=UPI000832E39D|nr:hypothetical protein [Halofilum ochraceum]